MQYLYRHFDKDNVLLYIGVSLNALNRLAQHADNAHWFSEISHVTIEKFPTRNDVLVAERNAIIAENPLHNLKRPSNVAHYRAEELRQAEESRRATLARIVQFNPTYSAAEVADMLGITLVKVKMLIASRQLGSVVVGVKNTGTGSYEKIRITGWQVIDFIEQMTLVGNIDNMLSA